MLCAGPALLTDGMDSEPCCPWCTSRVHPWVEMSVIRQVNDESNSCGPDLSSYQTKFNPTALIPRSYTSSVLVKGFHPHEAINTGGKYLSQLVAIVARVDHEVTKPHLHLRSPAKEAHDHIYHFVLIDMVSIQRSVVKVFKHRCGS